MTSVIAIKQLFTSNIKTNGMVIKLMLNITIKFKGLWEFFYKKTLSKIRTTKNYETIINILHTSYTLSKRFASNGV